MFSQSDLIQIFFPQLSPEEQAKLLHILDWNSEEYYADNWHKVQPLDLLKSEVKINLLRTYYQLQINIYDGVASQIMDSLESWSVEGSLFFDVLSADDNEFYERFYCFLGFQNFALQKTTRQMYLLTTRFLNLACLWNLSVYSSVAEYFSSYCDASVLKDEATILAGAIEKNQTVVAVDKSNSADSEGQSITVAEVVNRFNVFEPTDPQLKTSQFIAVFYATVEKDERQSGALYAILTLYADLLSDKIWKDLGYAECICEKGPREKINEDEMYLKILSEAKNLSTWLADVAPAVQFLQTKSTEFKIRALQILNKKVDLKSKEELGLLAKFLGECLSKNIFNKVELKPLITVLTQVGIELKEPERKPVAQTKATEPAAKVTVAVSNSQYGSVLVPPPSIAAEAENRMLAYRDLSQNEVVVAVGELLAQACYLTNFGGELNREMAAQAYAAISYIFEVSWADDLVSFMFKRAKDYKNLAAAEDQEIWRNMGELMSSLEWKEPADRKTIRDLEGLAVTSMDVGLIKAHRLLEKSKEGYTGAGAEALLEQYAKYQNLMSDGIRVFKQYALETNQPEYDDNIVKDKEQAIYRFNIL